jgi:hypothetical protein
MVFTHVAETLRLFSGMGLGLAKQSRPLHRFRQRRAWCAFDRWHDLDQL